MDSEILVARIHDTADLCDKNQKHKFLGFLSEEECVLAERVLSKRNVKYSLFGGYANARRKVLACIPDWADEAEFPITALTFSFRSDASLHHRDFLGSLMALGIKRETVGDILIGEGRAVVFVLDEVSAHILNNTEKIGRTGVKITVGIDGTLPECDSLTEFADTIASERLDCVVSALSCVSRSTAAEKIALGLVSVNSQVTEKATKNIIAGDIITIRGMGKFVIDSVDERTRKNRIILRYKKYV